MGGPQPWRNGGRGPLTPAERVARYRERKQRAQAAEALLAFRLVQELSDSELQELLYERPSQRRAVLYMAGDLARFRKRTKAALRAAARELTPGAVTARGATKNGDRRNAPARNGHRRRRDLDEARAAVALIGTPEVDQVVEGVLARRARKQWTLGDSARAQAKRRRERT